MNAYELLSMAKALEKRREFIAALIKHLKSQEEQATNKQRSNVLLKFIIGKK